MCDILQLENTEEILHAQFVGFATNCALIDLSKRNGIASFPVREIYSRVQKRAMRYGWCSSGKKQKSVRHFSCSRVVPFFIDSIFCHEAVRCPISELV